MISKLEFSLLGALLFAITFSFAGTRLDSIPYYRDKGIGVSVGIGILSANAGEQYNGQVGSQGSLTGLYYLGRGHVVGLGIGSQLAATGSGMLHYPAYFQYQYLFGSRPVLKLGTKLGYSFTTVDRLFNIYDSKGGLFIEPFAGIKLNRAQNWSWFFELGLVHQQLYYQYGDLEITGSEEHQEWRLWRFVFRTTLEF